MKFILGHIPTGLSFVCALLTIAIPYLVYKVNQKLHEIGDPSWKKK
ncbi:hypothetical protein [Paenibacillus sp. YIM B09110]